MQRVLLWRLRKQITRARTVIVVAKEVCGSSLFFVSSLLHFVTLHFCRDTRASGSLFVRKKKTHTKNAI